MFGLIKNKISVEEHKLEINGSHHKMKIYFERRRNARASVSRSGITIRIPVNMNEYDKRIEIEKLRSWAIDKIIAHPGRFSAETPLSYHSGQTIYIAGSPYGLNIIEENRKNVFAKISGKNIEIRIPLERRERTGKILSRFIAKEFLAFVRHRLNELNELHFRKHIGRITIRNNKSTWGSCAASGDIAIAAKLLLAPKEIIDYVFIHELSHLVVRGHSKKFWSVVERALPDYRQKRKWLRKNGHELRF